MDDMRIYIISTNIGGKRRRKVNILTHSGAVVKIGYVTKEKPWKKVLPRGNDYHITMDTTINSGFITYELLDKDTNETDHCCFIMFLYKAVPANKRS
jgi:hypothetical protein